MALNQMTIDLIADEAKELARKTGKNCRSLEKLCNSTSRNFSGTRRAEMLEPSQRKKGICSAVRNTCKAGDSVREVG